MASISWTSCEKSPYSPHLYLSQNHEKSPDTTHILSTSGLRYKIPLVSSRSREVRSHIVLFQVEQKRNLFPSSHPGPKTVSFATMHTAARMSIPSKRSASTTTQEGPNKQAKTIHTSESTPKIQIFDKKRKCLKPRVIAIMNDDKKPTWKGEERITRKSSARINDEWWMVGYHRAGRRYADDRIHMPTVFSQTGGLQLGRHSLNNQMSLWHHFGTKEEPCGNGWFDHS